MTREVDFESEAALLSWAFISARREGIDWLRGVQRESVGLDAQILELISSEWQAADAPSQSGLNDRQPKFHRKFH